MLVNTQVRQEEDGTIPSPKGRQKGREHNGCLQFTKIEDERCLVVENEDQIQNGSLGYDQSEAEFGTWAAHLASYIGMD
jgi:hypothetical protein